MNMGGFSNPNFNEKEEGREQDVVIPEFVDKSVDTNNVTSNLIISQIQILTYLPNLTKIE